jgi:hypothetical protein
MCRFAKMWAVAATLALVALGLGCNALIGLDPGKDPPPGAGGSSSTSATTTVASTSSAQTTGSGGAGPAVEYVRVFGDSASMPPSVGAITVDAAGNAYAAGQFSGEMKLDAIMLAPVGAVGVLVAKLSPTGSVVWATQMGFGAQNTATAVAVDSSGNVIVGGSGIVAGTTPGLFVAKLAAVDGTVMWAQALGGDPTSAITGLAATSSGDIILGGYFLDTIDFGDDSFTSHMSVNGPVSDGFIARLGGADGLEKKSAGGWATSFGADMSFQSVKGLGLDAAGDVFIAAQFSQGSFSLGSAMLTTEANASALLAELDTTGTLLWAQQMQGTSDVTATGLAVDAKGDMFLMGSFDGSLSFGSTMYDAPPNATPSFIATYSADQTYHWSKMLAGAPTLVGAFDGAGDVHLSGGFTGSLDLGGGTLVAEGKDVFVAELDGAGNVVWSERYGDPADQYAQAIGVTPSGVSIVAGALNGAIDFGSGSFSASGSGDFFVAALAP